ncbi:MAG: SsrA-binding protein SmpB [Planctomycetota bacterium]|nr:SsrA-binding protein SmpB [Planctomycetota bacterium]
MSGRREGSGPPIRPIAVNRRAWHDFHVEEKIEAGIELTGSEVKVLRANRVDFQGAHVRSGGGQAWLIHLKIPPYEKASVGGHDPLRPRRLLLHAREIARLEAKLATGGRTAVPLSLYFKGPWVKVEVGVCRGKSRGDRRREIREAEQKKALARARMRRR